MNSSQEKSRAPSDAVSVEGLPDRILRLLWGYSKVAALLVLLLFVFVSWNDVRALIPRVSRFQALGVTVEVSRLRNALEEQAKAISSPSVVLQPGAIEGVLTRALRVRSVFQGATILWIDDNPSNNLSFRQVLRALGAGVEPARSTEEALQLAKAGGFDLIVSDIDRGPENGIEGLAQIRGAGLRVPAIFYVLRVDRARPTPADAIGITNRPDELLHLVIDGLERARWTSTDAAEPPVAVEGDR